MLTTRVRGMNYKLRLLPLGAYIRMDMATLQRRTLVQQLFVLLAGIMVNLVLGTLALGTFFGTINLALALGNLFPIYQQDGWKAGMVISRRVFNRSVPVLEWSFTIAAGITALGLAALAVFNHLNSTIVAAFRRPSATLNSIGNRQLPDVQSVPYVR